METMNFVKVTYAAKAAVNGIIDANGNEFNVAKHPLMGVVPVFAVQVLGNMLYVGLFAEYDVSNRLDYNRVVCHNTDFVATTNKGLLYGVENNTDVVAATGDTYKYLADVIDTNNLNIRLLRL